MTNKPQPQPHSKQNNQIIKSRQPTKTPTIIIYDMPRSNNTEQNTLKPRQNNAIKQTSNPTYDVPKTEHHTYDMPRSNNTEQNTLKPRQNNAIKQTSNPTYDVPKTEHHTYDMPRSNNLEYENMNHASIYEEIRDTNYYNINTNKSIKPPPPPSISTIPHKEKLLNKTKTPPKRPEKPQNYIPKHKINTSPATNTTNNKKTPPKRPEKPQNYIPKHKINTSPATNTTNNKKTPPKRPEKPQNYIPKHKINTSPATNTTNNTAHTKTTHKTQLIYNNKPSPKAVYTTKNKIQIHQTTTPSQKPQSKIQLQSINKINQAKTLKK